MNQLLMQKMKNYVKYASVSQLKNIKPRELINVLNVDKKTFNEFIEFLNDERLLTYKYNIECDCGEVNTVYESQKNDNIICHSCGENAHINENNKVLYCIDDKKEFLEFDEFEIDFAFSTVRSEKKLLKENKDSTKVIKLHEGRENMKIFIGSSLEAKEDMKKIARILESEDNEPITWIDNEVFVAGQYTFESLIKTAEKVDAAIFIFKADDKTWYREKEIKSVRDNVLLEYGLFSGKLGPKKVIFICSGNPEIATDLKGITSLNLDTKYYTLCNQINIWLETIK